MPFPSIYSRRPDYVTGATDATDFRFEENSGSPCPVLYDYIVGSNSAKIIVHPSASPIRCLKLRFEEDLSFVESVCGDAWMTCGGEQAIYWSGVTAYRVLPWFCYLRSVDRMACYGVKTGADCFAYWQVDTRGITLFLNLMSGSGGTDLRESITACEIVEYIAPEGQNCFKTASVFAGMMCDAPVLPKEPVFGINDWYWAYGDVTEGIVKQKLDILDTLTDGLKHKPHLVIDDGWQIRRDGGEKRYIGGPWKCSEKFGDIVRTAELIRKRGAKPGIWYRSLLTVEDMPREAVLREHDNGRVMDPTHPWVLEKVASDTAMIRGYGFDFIKHDFSTWDIFGGILSNNNGIDILKSPCCFYDNTKTSAMVLKELYGTIQRAAGGAEVLGCGVVGHLSAGIHQMYRAGTDTSGRSFEWTVRNGVNSFMRLPQNGKFHVTDHDCAAFTEKVPFEENLSFLEACAVSGSVTIASVTPGLLNGGQLERIAEVFRLADGGNTDFAIDNFERTSLPERFLYNGEVREYNWFEYYKGSRSQLSWLY